MGRIYSLQRGGFSPHILLVFKFFSGLCFEVSVPGGFWYGVSISISFVWLGRFVFLHSIFICFVCLTCIFFNFYSYKFLMTFTDVIIKKKREKKKKKKKKEKKREKKNGGVCVTPGRWLACACLAPAE